MIVSHRILKLLTEKEDMSTQGRMHRIVIGFITPPIVGVILLYLVLLFFSKSELDIQFSNGTFLIGIPLSFVVTGTQSMVFSLLMEYVINSNTQNRPLSVLFAAVIGGISCAFFGWVFVVLGVLVGTILGWYLRWHFDKTVNRVAGDI